MVDIAAEDRGHPASMASGRWYGTSRNFRPRSHGSCLATTSARPFLPRASGSPRKIACRIAMKWLLPDPNEPSR